MTFISDLFHYGFWGMALVAFGKFGIVGNVVYSLFVFFYKEERNDPKTILMGTPVASCLASALMLISIYADGGQDPIKLSVVIIVFIWLYYFILIPQIAIFLINKRLRQTAAIHKRTISLALRAALTLVLPFGLAIIHIVVGQFIFGITPD